MNSLHLNRWLTSLLLLTMVVGLLLAGTGCEPEMTEIRLSPSNIKVAPGETFTMNVTIKRASSHYPAGIQFDLTFNSTLVTVDSVIEGDVFSESCNSTFFRGDRIDNEEGTISEIVCVVTEPGCAVSSSGTVATVTFTAGTETGSSLIGFNYIKVGNTAGGHLGCRAYGGTVEVSPP